MMGAPGLDFETWDPSRKCWQNLQPDRVLPQTLQPDSQRFKLAAARQAVPVNKTWLFRGIEVLL